MTTPPTAWSLAGLTLDAWCALPLAARISLAVAPYLGWPYRTGQRPAVAYASPGVPDTLVGPPERGVDCSTMTVSTLTAVYPRAGWTQQDYQDLQIYDAARRDSPMDAVERRGVGWRTVAEVVHGTTFGTCTPGRWHLVQGWRKSGGGHAFLVYCTTAEGLLKLESTSLEWATTDAYGIGPRWTWATAADLRRHYDAALYVAELLS